MTPVWVCAVVILLASAGKADQDVADFDTIKQMSDDVSQHLETKTQDGREMELTSTTKDLEELDADKAILSTIPSSEGTDETPEIQTTLEPEPEILPTPVPEIGTPEPYEATKNLERKKKPSVPKKGLNYEGDKPSVAKKGLNYEGDKPSVAKKGADPKELKPSVHARKEADPTNGTAASEATEEAITEEQQQPTPTKVSVVPRKDADPNKLKPSVYPRKDADPTNSTISEATMQSSSIVLQPGDLEDKDKISVPSAGKFSAPLNRLPSSSKKPTPALISDSKGMLQPLDPQATPISKPIGNTISSTTRSPNEPAANAKQENHNKPEAAIDDLKAAAAIDDVKAAEDDSQGYSGAYAPAAVAIVLLLCIVITVLVLAIRKVQDVWMKRHYARMDFLIDGMYDM